MGKGTAWMGFLKVGSNEFGERYCLDGIFRDSSSEFGKCYCLDGNFGNKQ